MSKPVEYIDYTEEDICEYGCDKRVVDDYGECNHNGCRGCRHVWEEECPKSCPACNKINYWNNNKE